MSSEYRFLWGFLSYEACYLNPSSEKNESAPETQTQLREYEGQYESFYYYISYSPLKLTVSIKANMNLFIITSYTRLSSWQGLLAIPEIYECNSSRDVIANVASRDEHVKKHACGV